MMVWCLRFFDIENVCFVGFYGVALASVGDFWFGGGNDDFVGQCRDGFETRLYDTTQNKKYETIQYITTIMYNFNYINMLF
ncbi:MAG: hypothetical protein IMY72_10815 [Bacteroidetes bacterium]|nr:hypothetical protein [Bacteroidota bacterium]